MRGNARGMKAKLSRKELDDLFSEVLKKKKRKEKEIRGNSTRYVEYLVEATGTFLFLQLAIYLGRFNFIRNNF